MFVNTVHKPYAGGAGRRRTEEGGVGATLINVFVLGISPLLTIGLLVFGVPDGTGRRVRGICTRAPFGKGDYHPNISPMREGRGAIIAYNYAR